MKKVRINNVYTERSYNHDKHEWDKYRDIQLEIGFMTTEQKVALCEFLLQKTDDNFSQTILSELAEDEDIPLNIIKEIFRKGDVGCKVSVCLRNNIDYEIKSMCVNCTDEDVVEHYFYKLKRDAEERKKDASAHVSAPTDPLRME